MEGWKYDFLCQPSGGHIDQITPFNKIINRFSKLCQSVFASYITKNVRMIHTATSACGPFTQNDSIASSTNTQ